MIQVPIVPKQAPKVLDEDGRFHDDWYLFFQVAAEYASTAAGIVLYGLSADRQVFDLENLVDGTLWFETDTLVPYQWRASGLVWVAVIGGFSGTVPLAKLTVGGTNGSITFSNGLAKGAVIPT